MAAFDMTRPCGNIGPHGALCEKSFGHNGRHIGMMDTTAKVSWRILESGDPAFIEYEV